MKIYILMAMVMLSLSSCLKNKDEILDYRGIKPIVINPKSNYPSKTILPTLLTDSAFGVTRLNLIAKYSFQAPAPRDLKIAFIRDDAAMAKYNPFNTFTPLPADAYEMSANEAIIPEGMQLGVLPVKIIPGKIAGSKRYIIAFSISSAEGIDIPGNSKTIIITLKGQ
ncbi:DUF1735 domain-containing protein [Pedobacter hiemivivus]|uniref:DUF1735 domain-containing protein n=1 Tax=Pedobacter hiemivivus TaxID=2530454 RepID=A0A4R0NKI2_9SPHI|nr:DUF1735 domain-containing protein [Pedobacter hiemivivus]TCC99464.1 DUF1735 domain-containing protein [Pedobacter hiemivivus]TKC63691.1 DUF1735 domain-containing protein [Pedobacter hiemivivus]